MLQRLGDEVMHVGMIHSDIHFANIISDGSRLAIIDFADCALGPYLIDIAVTEAEFQDYPEAETLLQHFREAYRQKRGWLPS